MPTTVQRVRERVERGADLVESVFGPAWVDDIDTATLDINNWDRCILGQLAAANHVTAEDDGILVSSGESLWYALRRRSGDDDDHLALAAHGFIGAPKTSRRAWVRIIGERRAALYAAERQAV